MSPFVAAFFLLGLFLANAINFTTVYEWDKVDFIWPLGADSSIGQMKQNFKQSNFHPANTAVFGERLFLSLDMVNFGIPASLVWLPTSGTSTAPPKFAPFPFWHLHEKDCDSIQVATGIAVDPDGRFWVVDDGSSQCSSKIWIFNLLKNDTIEHVHHFPDTVTSHLFSKRWLLDIVLEKTPEDYLAYITDVWSEHIIVYNRKMDKSWSVKTPGKKWYSLALSPNSEARQLYLTRVEFTELYSVSVSELKNEGGNATVKFIGKWTHQPYRMLIDGSNVMYAAFWSKNYVSKWNISEPFREQRFYEVGKLDAHWPFTFAMDTNGTFWMTERNQSVSGNRHKLLKAAVGVRSYQFSMSTSTAVTTPQAQGTTSVTASSRIPTEEPTRPIPTTSSSQNSSAPSLTTLSTTSENGKTTEVVKTLQTATGKIGTLRSALESNETSVGFAGLAEGPSLSTIAICLRVCCLVLCGTVILWLILRLRRIKNSFRQIAMENHVEMSVFPNEPVYDDVVGPEN